MISLYWDRHARANSVDPDQMPQNAASDQGLHCLPHFQQVVNTKKIKISSAECVTESAKR